MRQVRDVLGALLLLAVVLRVVVWLISPAIPALSVLFAVISILAWMLRGPSRLL